MRAVHRTWRWIVIGIIYWSPRCLGYFVCVRGNGVASEASGGHTSVSSSGHGHVPGRWLTLTMAIVKKKFQWMPYSVTCS